MRTDGGGEGAATHGGTPSRARLEAFLMEDAAGAAPGAVGAAQGASAAEFPPHDSWGEPSRAEGAQGGAQLRLTVKTLDNQAFALAVRFCAPPATTTHGLRRCRACRA